MKIFVKYRSQLNTTYIYICIHKYIYIYAYLWGCLCLPTISETWFLLKLRDLDSHTSQCSDVQKSILLFYCNLSLSCMFWNFKIHLWKIPFFYELPDIFWIKNGGLISMRFFTCFRVCWGWRCFHPAALELKLTGQKIHHDCGTHGFLV